MEQDGNEAQKRKKRQSILKSNTSLGGTGDDRELKDQTFVIPNTRRVSFSAFPEVRNLSPAANRNEINQTLLMDISMDLTDLSSDCSSPDDRSEKDQTLLMDMSMDCSSPGDRSEKNQTLLMDMSMDCSSPGDKSEKDFTRLMNTSMDLSAPEEEEEDKQENVPPNVRYVQPKYVPPSVSCFVPYPPNLNNTEYVELMVKNPGHIGSTNKKSGYGKFGCAKTPIKRIKSATRGAPPPRNGSQEVKAMEIETKTDEDQSASQPVVFKSHAEVLNNNRKSEAELLSKVKFLAAGTSGMKSEPSPTEDKKDLEESNSSTKNIKNLTVPVSPGPSAPRPPTSAGVLKTPDVLELISQMEREKEKSHQHDTPDINVNADQPILSTENQSQQSEPANGQAVSIVCEPSSEIDQPVLEDEQEDKDFVGRKRKSPVHDENGNGKASEDDVVNVVIKSATNAVDDDEILLAQKLGNNTKFYLENHSSMRLGKKLDAWDEVKKELAQLELSEYDLFCRIHGNAFRPKLLEYFRYQFKIQELSAIPLEEFDTNPIIQHILLSSNASPNY